MSTHLTKKQIRIVRSAAKHGSLGVWDSCSRSCLFIEPEQKDPVRTGLHALLVQTQKMENSMENVASAASSRPVRDIDSVMEGQYRIGQPVRGKKEGCCPAFEEGWVIKPGRGAVTVIQIRKTLNWIGISSYNEWDVEALPGRGVEMDKFQEIYDLYSRIKGDAPDGEFVLPPDLK